MPKMTAIHEIQRPGKNGKPEVIAPGKPFSASKEEAEYLAKAGAASLAAGATEDDEDDASGDQDQDKAIADMNGKELKAKAAALNVELPKGNPSLEVMRGLIQAKLDADMI